MGDGGIIGILFLATALAGPVVLALASLIRRNGDRLSAPALPAARWDWRQTVRSSLLYALAFNLVFFIQELFLVLPKAFTPGLRPTLFHNNHRWDGDHPLAHLFQGTGALAILLTGLICALLVRGGHGRSANSRLFLIWMAYHGFFQGLPQIVVGAMVPQNDVGMAMDYLALPPAAKTIAAVAALAAIVAAALWLTRPLLGLAPSEAGIATPAGRHRFLFRVATVPALIAIPAIILFRIPREMIEVVVPPVVVTIVGIGWIQANAGRARAIGRRIGPGASLLGPLLLLVALLLVFQLVLRPGIAFY